MRGKFWRNRIMSMLVSVSLAFFLWLALAGQDMSTLDLAIPLELANLPENLMIKSSVPGSVTIQVLANTAQSRFLADRKLHLWLNVATAKEGANTFQISDNSLDLPRGVQLRKITPSIIEFEAVELTSKTAPVKPVMSGRVSAGYTIKSVVIEPDYVVLKGPHELLENIQEVSTAPIVLDGLTQNQTLAAPLAADSLPAGVEATPKEVNAIVILEELRSEKTFTDLPIVIDQRNGDLTASDISISPSLVEVSLSWPIVRLDGVDPEEIQAKVYIDDEMLKNEGKLTLQIVVVPPEGVTVTAINPPEAVITYTPNPPIPPAVQPPTQNAP